MKSIYKYLIEIVIIVVGVLIAFHLTNWGNEVEQRKTEREIISQIYFELNNNLADLKGDMVIHSNSLLSQKRIQEFLDGAAYNMDSLMMDFYWVSKDDYIFPNSSAFENLNSTGMSILRNDSLRNLITLVYNNNFPRISKGNNLYPDINEYLSPYFEKNFKVNRDTSINYKLKFNDSLSINFPRDLGNGVKHLIGYIPLDIEKLKNDEEFRFLISETLLFRYYKVRFYQLSINNVENILRLIEREYPNVIEN